MNLLLKEKWAKLIERQEFYSGSPWTFWSPLLRVPCTGKHGTVVKHIFYMSTGCQTINTIETQKKTQTNMVALMEEAWMKCQNIL